MRKLFFILVIFSLILMPSVSFAAKGGEKGASEQALENASDQAIFNRVGDWFATVGKSKEEKDKIKAERSAKREAERIRKEAEKQVEGIEAESGKKAKEAKATKDKAKERLRTQETKRLEEKTMMQQKKPAKTMQGAQQGMQKTTPKAVGRSK